MSRIFPAMVALLMVGVHAGCVKGEPAIHGSGISKTEPRDVPAFTKIAVGGAFDVNVKIGQPQSVALTADDNLLATIETEVVDGTLKVKTTEPIAPKSKIKLDIVVPSITAAAMSGSGDMRLEGVSEPELQLSIAGSGDVFAIGTAGKLESSIAGSGSMKLEELAVTTADVDIAGSGDAELNVSGDLKVSIAGSGDVAYIGSPRQVKKKIAGSGSVRQKS